MTTPIVPVEGPLHTGEQPGKGKKVALFITCINDVMFPGTGQATVNLVVVR